MDLYTIQMGRWRKAKERDIPLLDTTIKSATDYAFLAPTWEMVTQYKAGRLSEQEYKTLYYEVIHSRWVENPEPFLALLRLPTAAIACYCAAGHFCHRLLLVAILTKIAAKFGIPFRYCGELV